MSGAGRGGQNGALVPMHLPVDAPSPVASSVRAPATSISVGKSKQVFSGEELNARAEASSNFNQHRETESPRAALGAVCPTCPWFSRGLSVSPRVVHSGLLVLLAQASGSCCGLLTRAGLCGELWAARLVGGSVACTPLDSVSHQGQMPGGTELFLVGREEGCGERLCKPQVPSSPPRMAALIAPLLRWAGPSLPRPV